MKPIKKCITGGNGGFSSSGEGTCGLFDFYSFDWELEGELSRGGEGSGY